MEDLSDFAFLSVPVHGAQLYRDAVTDVLPDLHATLGPFSKDQAGVRISGNGQLQQFLTTKGAIGSLAAGLLGPSSRAVRAILFDKTSETNWSLGWHQDRTICVKKRFDVAGFGPWTIKRGMQHVAPPMEILARMITLRVHLDDVPATNAPLLVALGSHRQGRIPEESIANQVKQSSVLTCIAKAGDVWAYATPILHASEAAADPKRRRVLQIDFAAEDLPNGLEWLGV